MHTRRDFLHLAAAEAAMVAATLAAGRATAETGGPARKGGPKLLVLGGTGFIGPHIVDSALARGFTVTLFNRGKTNPQLFPDVEKLHGDRKVDLKALEGRRWDAVVDTSGYFPKDVRRSAGLLAKNVGRYVFISSISVYADPSKPADESAAVGRLKEKDPQKIDLIDKIGEDTYGPLKALCEEEAEKAMPGRVTNIRPGFIVGPRDPTDRFTYWPVRVARGGEMLAPGTAADPIQIIDARDLAAWIVLMIERGHGGVYNAVGPAKTLTLGETLRAAKEVSGSDARFTWIDEAFLEQQKVGEEELPIWASPKGAYGGMLRTSARRAIDKGLTFRPVPVTIKDTLAYWQGLPEERRAKMRADLKPEKEAQVLAAWRARAGAGKPTPAPAAKPG